MRFGVLAATLWSLASSAMAQGEPAPEQAPSQEGAPQDAAPQEATKENEAKADEAPAQAAPAEVAPTSPTPVAEGAPVEEIQAAPATAVPASAPSVSATPATSTKPGDNLAGLSAQQRDLAVARAGGPRALVIFDNTLGTGGFVRNGSLRDSSGYFIQSLSVRPGYTFPFYGHTLAAGARFDFSYEMTTPNNEMARRWNLQDSRLTLSDPNVYTEPNTDIRFSAGLRWDIPTSRRSWNVTSLWGALGLSGSANRSIGPFDLSYGLSATKFLNSEKVAQRYLDNASGRDALVSGVNKDGPERILAGSANTSLALSHSASVTYNFDDFLSTTYQVGLTNAFNYAIAGARDQYTSPYADPGGGRTDQITAVLDFSYEFSRAWKDVIDVPFRMILSAGLYTWTPAQTADNKNIMWPVFVQAFGTDRASQNYGSFYFDVTGVFL